MSNWYINDLMKEACKSFHEKCIGGGLMGSCEENLYNDGVLQNPVAIQMDFIAASIEFMKEWKDKKIDEEEKLRKEKLRELNFTSSKTMEISNRMLIPGFRAKCFQWFEENFPGCFFLPTEIFISLTEAHNLVCGALDRYTGELSDEDIDKIYETVKTLEKIRESNLYSNRKDEECFYDIILSVKLYDRIKAFERPIINDKVADLLRFPFNSAIIRDVFPYPDKLHILKFPTTPSNLFIVAPAKYMKKLVVKPNMDRCRSKGAFIFQLTPYGVVIFHKLGKADEDDNQ